MTIVSINSIKKIAVTSVVLLPAIFSAREAAAEDFTAAVVLRDYDDSQRALFLTGLVEGLAQARYEQDDKEPAGAKCIYDWFYVGRKDTLLKIYGAFASNSNSAPAAVVSALVKQECGS